jgi:hypothetical protein
MGSTPIRRLCTLASQSWFIGQCKWQRSPFISPPPHEGKLSNHVKQVNTKAAHPSRGHYTSQKGSLPSATVSKTGLTIAVGLLELRVRRKNPPVNSASPKANRARDKVTHRMASSWCYPRPHRGHPASSIFVSESQSGGCPICVCWDLAIWILSIGTTRE